MTRETHHEDGFTGSDRQESIEYGVWSIEYPLLNTQYLILNTASAASYVPSCQPLR